MINENKDVFASKDSELGHTGKSLEENVDNILSVDSTVYKICCMLIESTKTTFGNYNSTKRINNCTFKLNKPWFDGDCKNTRTKYRSSKRRSKNHFNS